MFDQQPETGRGNYYIGWSIAGHAAIVAVLLVRIGPVKVRTLVPGTPQGVRLELSYLPGGTSHASPTPARLNKPHPPKIKPSPVPYPAAAPAVEAPAAAKGAGSAEPNDALGTEDIQIALTTYSPSPKPDLSHVPHGTQGDVVIDITIDPEGKVADLQILHALGYGVEGTVANTVRTWTFKPAMKDGTPVASIQELHFHYGPV